MKKLQSYLMLFIFALSLVPAFIPAPVKAQELTEVDIQPDGNSGYDTYMSATSSTTNYETAVTMLVGETSADDTGRALLTWDLSGLPSDADIDTAVLSLWVAEDLATNASTLQVYMVRKPWTETHATWSRYRISPVNSTDEPWDDVGASGEDDTWEDLAAEVEIAADLTAGTLVEITLDTALVGHLLRENFYGILLRTEDETNDAYTFHTSDATDETKRPKLHLEYDPSPEITDPGWYCLDGTRTCEPEMDNAPTYYSPYYHYNPEANVNSDLNEAYNFRGNYTFIGAKIKCEPYPECRNDYPIYYGVIVTYEWTSYSQKDIYANTTVVITGSEGDVIADQRSLYCNPTGGYTDHGYCSAFITGVITPGEIPELPGSGILGGAEGMDIYLQTHIVFYTGYPVSAGVVSDFYLSRTPPESSCADTYAAPIINKYVIDPTIETPVGMANAETPTDENAYETEIGSLYMLRVEDGPYYWNGTTPEYQTQVSTDGTTYTDLQTFAANNENVVCFDVDPLNPWLITVYFTAPSEAVYIRVWDAAGETPSAFLDNTNDEDTPLSYSIGLAYIVDLGDCLSQFTYDEQEDWVASLVVLGDSEYTLATDDMQVAEWYAVEIASGSWRDLPDITNLQTLEYVFSDGLIPTVASPWEDLAEGSSAVECEATVGDKIIVFVQAESISFFLRVNDIDDPLNFEDNQGSLGVNIYHAAFERSQETCELSFALDQIVRTDSVDAKQIWGKTMGIVVGTDLVNNNTQTENFLSYGLVPGAWYALETYGGPWGYRGSMHGTEALDYDMAISVSSIGARLEDLVWTSLSEWDGSECNIETDAIGHRLVYFQIPNTAALEYKLRVDDWDDWFNNDGVMSWNLYRAIDLGPEDSGICDYSYSEDDKINTEPLTVRANAPNGAYIQTGIDAGELMPNTYYAVKILGADYQWYEQSGADPQTDMELSMNNGTSWADLPGGALCGLFSGENYIFYLRSGNDVPKFKLRVNSTTFEDNLESMAYNIYTAEAGPSINPYDGCVTDGYSITTLNSYEWIPVRDPNGIGITATSGFAEIAGLVPGNRYVVETSRGPWYDAETTYDNSTNLAPLYKAQVSSDGGVTWDEMDGTNPNVTCWEYTPDFKYYKIEFTATEGQVWRIRVKDTESAQFEDNTGNLAYTLKGLVLPADTSVVGNFTLAGCNSPPIFPGMFTGEDLLNIGNYFAEWFDYIVGSVVKFFAWCPENTAAVTQWGQDIYVKEPFATLDEMDGVIGDIMNEINGYDWDSGNEDYSVLTKSPSESSAMIKTYIFGPLPDGSPWRGGKLVDFGSYNPSSNYSENCNLALIDYVGPLLGQGICFSSNWAKEVGLIFWTQLMFDVAVIFACLRAVTSTGKSLFYLITGVNFGGGQSTNVVVSGPQYIEDGESRRRRN